LKDQNNILNLISAISCSLNFHFLYGFKTILNLLEKNRFERTVFLLTLLLLGKIVAERNLL